jgi:Ca-activated chloride channel family protein
MRTEVAAIPVEGEDKDDDVIQIPIELVLLDVTVLDKSHRAINGLDLNTFRIYEDKAPQRIEYFSCEDAPISIGFVIDTSGSMRYRLPIVTEAARSMLGLARTGDEFFVVQFKETAQLVEEFTTDTSEIHEALNQLLASQGTALLDAIYVSSDYLFKEAKNRRKVLIVISDGDERDSFYKAEQLLAHLREQDIKLYIMGFPNESGYKTKEPYTPPETRAVKLINQLAEESGGRAFFPYFLYDIPAAIEQISEDIHSQYTIGYFSTNEKRDGKWRRIQVKLEEKRNKDLKDYTVHARSGYFATAKLAKKP